MFFQFGKLKYSELTVIKIIWAYQPVAAPTFHHKVSRFQIQVAARRYTVDIEHPPLGVLFICPIAVNKAVVSNNIHTCIVAQFEQLLNLALALKTGVHFP
jgi:hypothetical protein